MTVTTDDRRRLRKLARRVAEIGELPEMAARRDLWRRHNAMEPSRPVVYVDPQGSWGELILHQVEAAPRAPGQLQPH